MLVGLIGKAMSGKTTTAKVLTMEYGFLKISFADSLKRYVINAELATHEDCYVEKSPGSRKILQRIGTEIFRKQVKDSYWIDIAMNKIDNITEKCPYINIVIDDIRFPNEVEEIKKHDGFVIKVTRNENVDSEYTSHTTEPVDGFTDMQHDSERLVDELKYDHLIEAKSGDIKSLQKGIREIMNPKFYIL